MPLWRRKKASNDEYALWSVGKELALAGCRAPTVVIYIGGLSPLVNIVRYLPPPPSAIVKGFIISRLYLLGDKFTIYTCDVLVPSWFPSPVNYCNLNEVPHTTIITLSDWWRVYSWL